MTEISSQESLAATRNCTRCDDSTSAVKYCFDCGDRICEEHFKVRVVLSI